MALRKVLWAALLIVISGLALAKTAEAPAPVFSTAMGKEKIPILMYHKVSPYIHHGGIGLRVTPDNFECQMKYLYERGYKTITLNQLFDFWDRGESPPPRTFILTLDDGYEDNYLFAFPILKKYGFTATVFLVYDHIGGYNVWDIRRETQPHIKLLSWQQIKEMQAYGISFQSHTLSHPSLTTVDPQIAETEIRLSKIQLEQALGAPVNFLAYPYGRSNKNIEKMARAAGYKAALSTAFGKNDINTNRFRLKRLGIRGNTDLDDFARLVER